MNTPNCDFSPMKQQITEEIEQITNELRQSLQVLENDSFCLLGKLENIKGKFLNMEAAAASFYLNCYLSGFTDKYSELAECVQRLSDHHHGALIVVERSDSLENIIQIGMPVDAILTPALLETIFYPGNPLHDGAVLIRGDKIVSAGNILPLTSTTTFGKKVGTRHRAALGISEKSDALVLVVSEETGRVSFALDGKFYPIITGPLFH
jgi:diadenylate cyclase